MEVEYAISTGKKIFYGVFATFLIAIALLGFTTNGQLSIVLGSVFTILMAVMVGGQLRKKVTVSVDRIIATNILQTKELPTADIKGCRIGSKVIVIEPTSPSNPKITINNYQDFANSEDLTKWLKENFKDLDATDLAREREMLLSDSALGATTEERQARITKSKRIGWTYSGIGMFFGFLGIFLDKKPAAVIILIAYPLLGILIMAVTKGLIKFISSTKKSVYSFTFLGLFMPSFVLCLTGALGYDIYDFHNAFVPAGVICLATATLFYVTGFNKDMQSMAGQVIAMLLVSAPYGFGCVLQINCEFDNSAPQVFRTTINSKSKNYSKREHYYLDLNPFSPGQSLQNTEVSGAAYFKYNVGDTIQVDLKKGVLNIPWYYLPDDM